MENTKSIKLEQLRENSFLNITGIIVYIVSTKLEDSVRTQKSVKITQFLELCPFIAMIVNGEQKEEEGNLKK